MDEIPAPDAELRTVMVRTDKYVFEATRGADGRLTTTYIAIPQATPDRRAGANPPQGGKAP